MNYTIVENALTKQELEIVDTVILGDQYPWYYYATDIDNGPGFPFMCHTLMRRSNCGTAVAGIPNSGSYDLFKLIFDRLCPDHTMLRAALNLTFHNPVAHSTIHVDHLFPHRNLIIYLNQTEAGTLLFDEQHCVTDRIPCKRNTAVHFSGVDHAQEHCAPGQVRLVAVFTYV